MTAEQLKAYCKTSLRITSTAFDQEIDELIAAGESDITQATDALFDITDSVQCNAVALYVQAYFGYGDDKALARYKDILQSIGLRKIKYAVTTASVTP